MHQNPYPTSYLAKYSTNCNSQKYFKLNYDNMKKVMQNLKFVIMDKGRHCAYN